MPAAALLFSLAALFLLPCAGGASPPDSDGASPPIALADDDCDGVDQDHDGEVDEGWEPVPTACGIGACTATGFLVCIEGELADDCLADDPLYDDDSCDGVDDDCDAEIDESAGGCDAGPPVDAASGVRLRALASPS